MLRSAILASIPVLAASSAAQVQLAQWFSPDADQALERSLYEHVAIDGDTLFVESRDTSGLQYVTLFSLSSGLSTGELAALDNVSSDAFGSSLAARDGLLVAGAPGDDDFGSSSGSAYLFDVQSGLIFFKLRAGDPASFDAFGTSVAMSATTILVGSPSDDDAGFNSGSGYLFDRATGAELRKLVPPTGSGNFNYGMSVAISGNYALLGGPSGDVPSSNIGGCLVYEVSSGLLLGSLVASDQATNDRFGTSVALDGTLAVVGGPGNDSGFGSAYLFDVVTRQQLFKVLDPGVGPDREFGASVAVRGSSVLVGTLGSSSAFGSGHLFAAGSGQLVESFEQPDLSSSSTAIDSGVALDDDFLVTSSRLVQLPGASLPGTSYIYQRPQNTLINVATSGDSAAGDKFGSALAALGEAVLIGAPGDDDGGDDSGSVYLADALTGELLLPVLNQSPAGAGTEYGHSVARDGNTGLIGIPGAQPFGQQVGAAELIDLGSGALLYVLSPSNGGDGDRFGHSVDVQGGRAIVGAPMFGGGDKGLAYVFDVATGSQLVVLRSDDHAAGDLFGESVAIFGQLALVGAPLNDARGSNSGAAYVFDALSGDQLYKLTASDGTSSDNFGEAVALNGITALVGAPFFGPGKAYVYDALSGAQTRILAPSDGLSSDRFGMTLAVREAPFDTRAVIGSKSAGSAGYVFDLQDGTQLAKLTIGGSTSESPGVAISGDRIFVGAPAEGSLTVFEGPSPVVPFTYCTAKASSIGCLAQIGTSNPFAQPVSGANNYFITTIGAHSFKLGLVFASISGPSNIPFLGGTLCVSPPIAKRGPIVDSGGTLPNTCTGSFATLINDGQSLQSSIMNALDGGPGTPVYYQYWYRDPANGAGNLGTALSNAVRVDFE